MGWITPLIFPTARSFHGNNLEYQWWRSDVNSHFTMIIPIHHPPNHHFYGWYKPSKIRVVYDIAIPTLHMYIYIYISPKNPLKSHPKSHQISPYIYSQSFAWRKPRWSFSQSQGIRTSTARDWHHPRSAPWRPRRTLQRLGPPKWGSFTMYSNIGKP